MVMRHKIPLNGTWEFTCSSDVDPVSPELVDWSTVLVPSSYQSNDTVEMFHFGTSWYRKIDVPEVSIGDDSRYFLCFEAVNYFADVYVNGTLVCSHEGGYTPFEVDITNFLKTGNQNEFMVRVDLPGPDSPEPSFRDIPHGKQDWYGPGGGLWQDVYIENRPVQRISDMYVNPDAGTETVAVEWSCVGVCEAAHTQAELRFHLFEQGSEGAVFAETTRIGIPEAGQFSCKVENPILWSTEQPFLYQMTLDLIVDGKVVDQQSRTFGFRTIHVSQGKIFLNGAPLYVIGVLDQDLYPNTGYTPPSREYLRDQFKKAKHMGINLLRLHIKVPYQDYLDLADEIGLLIWYDLPNWGISSDKDRRHIFSEYGATEGIKIFTETIRRERAHPSIIIRSIINEDWGTDLVHNPQHRVWLRETFDYLKGLDPRSLLVDNSACCGNFHVKSDLEDYHTYFSVPDNRKDFDYWLRDFASRPSWTFAPDDTIERTGEEALVVSEFGNWGLPVLSGLSSCYQNEPAWISQQVHRNADAGVANDEWGVIVPEGFEERFHQYGLHKIFGSVDKLAVATQKHQFDAIAYQIRKMRLMRQVQGYVITELTDIHWEANGMLDMCRNPKIHFDRWQEVNNPDIVLLDVERWVFTRGEDVKIPLHISLYSSNANQNLSVEWEVLISPSTEVHEADLILAGSITDFSTDTEILSALSTITFSIPEEGSSANLFVKLRLVNQLGSVIYTGFYEFYVYPKASPIEHENVLIQHGGVFSSQDLAEIERGAAGILLIDKPGEYKVAGYEFTVEQRSGISTGNWASNFNWVDPMVFPSLITDGLLGFSCDGLDGSFLIQGCPDESARAGMIIGWIHSAGHFIVELPIGSGIIFVSTLNHKDTRGNPVGNIALRDLATYAARNSMIEMRERR